MWGLLNQAGRRLNVVREVTFEVDWCEKNALPCAWQLLPQINIRLVSFGRSHMQVMKPC